MGRKSRQEKEIKRLVGLGRGVSSTHSDHDESGREYNTAVSLQKVGSQYYVMLDIYYPTGSTGESIKESEMVFENLEDAIKHVKDVLGFEIYEFHT